MIRLRGSLWQILRDFWRSLTAPVEPDPVTPPVPQPVPLTADAIDPASVSWDEPARDVGAWPITATMERVTIRSDRRMLSWLRTGKAWPEVMKPNWKKPAVGNIWVGAKLPDGIVHFVTFDWLANVTQKGLPDWSAKNDLHHPGMESWVPSAGETVYFMLSTFARDGLRTTNERSNIVAVRWP